MKFVFSYFYCGRLHIWGIISEVTSSTEINFSDQTYQFSNEIQTYLLIRKLITSNFEYQLFINYLISKFIYKLEIRGVPKNN